MDMTSPLQDRTYRQLFTAQVVALAGTGLSTIALALLAYDLAGGDAGIVLGAGSSLIQTPAGRLLGHGADSPDAGASTYRAAAPRSTEGARCRPGKGGGPDWQGPREGGRCPGATASRGRTTAEG